MPPYICPHIDRGFPQPYMTIKKTDHEERLLIVIHIHVFVSRKVM